MFQLKPMRPGDFHFATRLTNTMDWNMADEDFQFNVALEPKGCFVAFNGRERIAISTCISFGKVGWFGNLIVKENYRNKGVGSLLVKRSADYLQGIGVQTVGLYAYTDLVGFYNNLGFVQDEDFSVFHTEALNPSTCDGLPSAGKEQNGAIEAFDRKCFGGDRKRLLESIILEKGNLCNYTETGGELSGYVAATVYEKMAWVGPLVCQKKNTDDATNLLKPILSSLAGKETYAVLPKKEVALANILFKAGFKQDFSVVRMFSGPPIAKNCIYMAESLERG